MAPRSRLCKAVLKRNTKAFTPGVEYQPRGYTKNADGTVDTLFMMSNISLFGMTEEEYRRCFVLPGEEYEEADLTTYNLYNPHPDCVSAMFPWERGVVARMLERGLPDASPDVQGKIRKAIEMYKKEGIE